ncbi:hypothetical protein A2865_01565 [Candidatus Woesebacteria bacterium RIFCSPHIGHO2_01_FULL_39_17]|uniref:O-antigen ligase-related domain-containing protein n=3 Tax=Candidatus Woeseibacteriota TaxID=1752722 RepID=A0A0G0REZ9_9BACT|nr:MAG: hypothetical protein US72_C0003G0048 [Microgenomates group bacterium GW2011_GWC1_38_12]KKQ94473.1 MAG: hypothetical protein UT19_C0001G0005 [Candidatus Woesebacteria bacterium GW2011_GWB1_39_10b]KKR12222.1 MAG: hypothetical protein UT40_C0028G0009 [Candidatus Woesebacteria bacterium GW2011_GWA1_39_21b]OGM22230.1 MAG: hypothetical protein A2865_01565 [Candidatus Woesebacteria bacterium RIFCSPHIGHO2_01_FULL_39_17]OGM62010.1 MAG: hypothetical protein A3A52_02005 [Candidatus Woesebacteria b
MLVKQYIFITFFLLGLLIYPFVYWLPASIPFEIPRVFFIQRWIELVALTGIILLFPYLKKERIDKLLIFLAIIFFAVTIIASVLGPDVLKSVGGNLYRGDGLVTLAHLVALSFVVALFIRKTWFVSVVYSISLAAAGISAWAVYDSLSLYFLKNQSVYNWDGAIATSFGNPNFLAGYLLVTLPLLYFLWKTTSKQSTKKFWLIVIGMQMIAILLTFAWAGAFGILTFFLISFVLNKTKRKILFISLIILALLSLGLFFKAQKQKEAVPDRLIAEGRQRIFTKGILAFRERPFLGWGWANFDYAFESVDWPIAIKDDVYVDKAHSTFLEVLVTSGIVGFTLYLALIVRILMNLWTNNTPISRAFLVSFLLYVIHSQTNVISIAEEVVFWIILGFSAKST